MKERLVNLAHTLGAVAVLTALLLTMMFGIKWAGARLDAQTRPTTVMWDQPNTIPVTSYVLLLDGTRTPLQALCVGTTYPKPCSAPLPSTIDMTTQHTLRVIAVGEWGETASDPLLFGPPSKPQGVGVGRD